jgi:undecaprenyl diphosphate synthase
LKVLNHVALILDGNRRWAKERGLPTIEGYKMGSKRVREIVSHAIGRDVSVLTMYFFSTENWSRTPEEVSGLFDFMRNFLIENLQQLIDDGVRIQCLGRLDRLPKSLGDTILFAMEQTKNGGRILLNIALDYGGRDEIVRSVNRLLQNHKNGNIHVTEELLSEFLDAPNVCEPDLVIRTGGEMRISNFLLWQIAYAELYFSKTLWPDFTTEEFDTALSDYQLRNRRRGGDARCVSRFV